ncbi:hypothetical protein P7C73_g1908, partial [Tremellales sp. Uapishka_1]
MFAELFSLVLAVWAVNAGPVKRWTNPVVDLGYATYEGVYNETNNVQYFLNIKYGADTSGNNRFRAPQPPPALAGIQYANVSGPSCPATNGGNTNAYFNATQEQAFFGPQYSEDCLLVNVYLPPGTTVGQSSMPVLVNIHGGGYILGDVVAISSGFYDVTYGPQFIFVDVSYRLAAFGFLAGTEVHANGDLNVGLLDQQAALQWVHDNIAKFGGDPEQVTIYGVSAGAGSVMHQIIANNGNTPDKLFTGAISSSTFTPPEYNYDDPVVEGLYQRLVGYTNCTTASDTLSCLRSLSLDALIAADYNATVDSGPGDYTYTPVVDGTFVADRPSVLLAQGKINGDTVWAGHNINEGRIYAGIGNYAPLNIGNNVTAQAEWISGLWPHFNASLIGDIQGYYNAETFGTVQNASEYLYGENIFGCPAVWLAEAFEENGYLSVYGHLPSFHGSDQPITLGVFRSEIYLNGDAHWKLGQATLAAGYPQAIVTDYMDTWTTYAATNKFVGDGVNWQAFLTSGKTFLNFNTTADQSAIDNTVPKLDEPYIQRCGFWRSISAITPQ